jgi:hypothetical protein
MYAHTTQHEGRMQQLKPKSGLHASPCMVLMLCPYMYVQTQHEGRIHQLNQRALLATPPPGTNERVRKVLCSDFMLQFCQSIDI